MLKTWIDQLTRNNRKKPCYMPQKKGHRPDRLSPTSNPRPNCFNPSLVHCSTVHASIHEACFVSKKKKKFTKRASGSRSTRPSRRSRFIPGFRHSRSAASCSHQLPTPRSTIPHRICGLVATRVGAAFARLPFLLLVASSLTDTLTGGSTRQRDVAGYLGLPAFYFLSLYRCCRSVFWVPDRTGSVISTP